MGIYFCLCILAGEQWTSRAAGNQPWGFHDSEERRRIGEHVAVAVANQQWCQLTEKLESPWWLPTSPPSLYRCHCCVQCVQSVATSPNRFFQWSSPFSWTIYSMMLQSCIPVWWFRHKQHAHTSFSFFLLLLVLLLFDQFCQHAWVCGAYTVLMCEWVKEGLELK